MAGPGDVYGVEGRRDTNGMLEALNNSAVRAVDAFSAKHHRPPRTQIPLDNLYPGMDSGG